MKQTAVEWLLENLNSEPYSEEEFNYNSDCWDKAIEMEKEQMINFAEFVATYPDKNVNINGEMLHAKSKYDGAERTIDLLKEYYESKTNI